MPLGRTRPDRARNRRTAGARRRAERAQGDGFGSALAVMAAFAVRGGDPGADRRQSEKHFRAFSGSPCSLSPRSSAVTWRCGAERFPDTRRRGAATIHYSPRRRSRLDRLDSASMYHISGDEAAALATWCVGTGIAALALRSNSAHHRSRRLWPAPLVGAARPGPLSAIELRFVEAGDAGVFSGPKRPDLRRNSLRRPWADDIDPRASGSLPLPEAGVVELVEHAGFSFLWRKPWGFKSFTRMRRYPGTTHPAGKRLTAVGLAGLPKKKPQSMQVTETLNPVLSAK